MMIPLRAVPLALVLVVLSGCSAQNASLKFDPAYSFSMLKKQCDFGPRPVGTRAHAQTKDFLVKELSRYSDSVDTQDFSRKLDGRECEMSNIIARFGTANTTGILLCAHWDTRPIADQDMDSANRKKPILGADDGASGVAVLLGLARIFHERAPALPVTIVLFDGEDYGPSDDYMFLGSQYFADRLGKKPPYRFGILLDMIGQKQLELRREGYSQGNARSVVDKIWAAGKEAGFAAFKDDVKYTVLDDQLPLTKAGVPTADVIDFDYPYWHTVQDTVDKCSPDSLKTVGDTIAKVVYAEKP